MPVPLPGGGALEKSAKAGVGFIAKQSDAIRPPIKIIAQKASSSLDRGRVRKER